MIGFAQWNAGGLDPGDKLVIARIVHLERDVVETADFRGLFRLRVAVDFIVGEREERECAAVAEAIESVAKRDLPADPMIEVLLAPGGGQWDAQYVFEELAVFLLIPHDIRVVMQALRRVSQKRSHRIPPMINAPTLLPRGSAIKPRGAVARCSLGCFGPTG